MDTYKTSQIEINPQTSGKYLSHHTYLNIYYHPSQKDFFFYSNTDL
jgi:hypothetical protein